MWPVTGNYEARVAGTTTIKAAWGDALDAALNGIYGSTRTLLGVQLDGSGYTSKAALSRTVKAWGGTLHLASDTDIILEGGNVYVQDGTLATQNGYGIVSAQDVAALRDILATRKLLTATAISSATVGAGQAVGAGEIWKDTTLFAAALIQGNGAADPTFIRGFNIAGVIRDGGPGKYKFTLQTAAPNYLLPIAMLELTNWGVAWVRKDSPPTTTTFRMQVTDGGAGATHDLANDEFMFVGVVAL